MRAAEAGLLKGLIKAVEAEGAASGCTLRRVGGCSKGRASGAATARHRLELGMLQREGAVDSDPTGVYGTFSDQNVLSHEMLLPSPCQQSLGDFQLVPGRVASLSGLEPRALQVADLSPGQLAVRVRAVGVNFRDLLNVLGMYPGDPGLPGGDCAGVVVASRAQSGPRPGEAVFGLAVGSLGTMVHCSPDTLVAMPACLSFEEAASMPTVFITAQLVFRSATDVQAGESVLVHAAAGGVGLASLQVLRAMQARVVATAGSPSKRALLRQLGVEDVAGSRGTAFVEAAAQLGGVDVVLNTLTSPGMIAATASVLRLGGRFVEISKRDIWSPARLQQERPDVQYNFVAVDFLPNSSVQAALSQVCAGVCRGQLHPLPTANHGLVAVATALRQMSQARHMGKVVVSAPSFAPSLSPSSSVLITGGLGALGLITARWLLGQGVKQVHLTSRSGRATQPGSENTVLAALADAAGGHGALVTLSSCDVASSEEAACLMLPGGRGGGCQGCMPAPVAVIHAGGVLADSVLSNQTLDGLRKVCAGVHEG